MLLFVSVLSISLTCVSYASHLKSIPCPGQVVMSQNFRQSLRRNVCNFTMIRFEGFPGSEEIFCQKIIKEYIKRIVCYKKCKFARQEIIDCMLYSGNPGSGWDPVVFLFLFVYVFVFVFVLVFAGDPPSAWKPWEKCIRRLHSSPPRSCPVHLVPWCLHRCRMLLPPTGQALCWNSPVIIHALFPLVIISHFYNSDSVWKPFSWRRKSLKTSVLGCLNVISDDWNSYQSIIIWEKAFDHHSPSQTLPKPWGSQSSWSPLHPCASTETPQLDMLLSKNVSIISST